jgi:hypothetical protein
MVGKVVVPVHLNYFRNKEHDFVAAHSRDLGLTGYGKTEEEAHESFKRVFSVFIRVSRSEGFLKSMLDRIGVRWYMADECTQDYEDVSDRCYLDSSTFVEVGATDTDIKMAA